MGCCASSQEQKPLNPGGTSSSSSSSSSSPAATTAAATSSKSSTDAAVRSVSKTREDQIALALKSKRANVFTESVDADSRRAFAAKNIPKTPAQEQIISTSSLQVDRHGP